MPQNIGFSYYLLVIVMKFIINSLQGCLKVVVYLLKGAAKFFLVKKGAVNQKRLRNTDLEHGYKVKWGLNDVFNL